MQKLEAGIHHFQATYFARHRRLFEQLASVAGTHLAELLAARLPARPAQLDDRE